MRYSTLLKLVIIGITYCSGLCGELGVRVSEVINVTPKDIEYKNGVVNIRKAKGGRQRRVPLDQDTLKMLSDYV